MNPTEFGEAYPFSFFIKDDKNNIIAGANGFVIYGTIYSFKLAPFLTHK